MTREEAIRELKIQFVGEYDRQREAKDMAIKALEKKPCEDCISRQAAIDIVKFECGKWSGLAKTIAKAIEQLHPHCLTPKQKSKRYKS